LKKNVRTCAQKKAQRTTESASDADENMLRFELAIFHETNMAFRPAQVYANLKGTQNEKVLWFDRGHPHCCFAEMLNSRGMQEAVTQVE
jgi:hypothetical protein